ncbi:MAG: hypothetical protein AAF436_05335 [Myxococcota bacterium]
MARSRPRFGLLEVALLVSIGATLLAVFIPTFARRVRTNKILEASMLLRDMRARAASYYATEWPQGQRCLPQRAGPTPAAPTVDAEPVDFHAPGALGHETWEALGFQPARPVRYSYRYTPTDTGCELGGETRDGVVVFSAEGDLDADDVRSRFELHATPQLDGTLAPDGVLRVHRRIE